MWIVIDINYVWGGVYEMSEISEVYGVCGISRMSHMSGCQNATLGTEGIGPTFCIPANLLGDLLI